MLTVDSQIDLQDMEAVFDMEWLKYDGVYYVQKLTYNYNMKMGHSDM